MGQLAISSLTNDCSNGSFTEDCLVTMSKHAEDIFGDGPAFGKVDEANCLLLRSSKDGDVLGIQQALTAGADVNTRLPMWIRIRIDDDGPGEEAALEEEPRATSLTPLMFASCEGQLEAVDLLLSSGAKLDLTDADGMQALHMAAQASSAECFNALLNAGANPLARDNFGRKAMECVPPDVPSFGAAAQKWPESLKKASTISDMITGVVSVAEADGEVFENAVVAGTATATVSISSEQERDEYCVGGITGILL